MNKITLKIFLTLISMVLAKESFTQESYSIKGIVKDQNDSLVFANAMLLNKSDSSLIKGSFIQEGILFIEGVMINEAILKIESIDIKTRFITITRPMGNELNLNEIRMKSIIVLDGAEITALKPAFVVNDSGDIRINVKGSILESSTSVRDVLSKSPSVILEDGVISVFGKGEALVLLNGKLISNAQLQAIPVSNIESIEILSNPPAKYDASGNTVINIKMVENPREGLLGEIVQTTTFAKHPQSYTVLTLNFRKNKLALQGSYGQDVGRNWGENRITRESFSDIGTTKSINDFEDNSNLKYYNNYNFGATYTINKKNNLSLEYSGNSSITEHDSRAETTFLDLDQDSTIINTVNYGENRYLSNSLNMNYNHVIDTLGSSLFFGGQYFIFNNEDNSLIDESIVSSAEANFTRMNVSTSDISFGTVQFDVLKNLRSDKNKLEFGAKLVSADNRGDVDFFSKPNDSTEFSFFPSLSNDFRYNELIGAAYVQYATDVNEKTNVSLGVRSELTDANGFSNALNQTIIDTNYINLFPSLQFGHQINKDWNLNLSFSSSIKRPSYQALDPFLFYIDSLTTSQGNPTLKPEYGNSIESNIRYKRYSLKVGYTLTNDAFRYAFLPEGTDQNSSVLKQINVEREHSFFATLQLPMTYKIIRSMNILGVTMDQVDDTRPEFASRSYVPRVYLFSNNMIKVKELGKMQVGFRYLGTRDDGIYHRKPAYNLSLGWSMDFFKEKLNFTFLADDVFHSFVVDGFYELSNTKVSYLRKMNTQLYRFTLVYRFGKLKESGFSPVNVGANSSKRIRK